MAKVLITGGAGFIGAHVGKALLERGDELVILDDFNDFLYTPDLKEARIRDMFTEPPQVIRGTVLDAGLVDRVMQEEKIERVVHLAALANPGRSVDAAEAYARVNILGTLNVLHSAQHHGVEQVIFAGSSSVYDDSETPFREDAWHLQPRSPYGASKAAAEIYCLQWHRLHGLPITVLRFFSVYGPYGRPDMAPMILADRLLRDVDMELTKNRKRDFTAIDDVVPAVLSALDTVFPYEVINIGRGEPIDLSDFVAALEKAVGRKAKIVWREAPLGEMEVTYADISKAKKLLGYEPKISVEEGVKRLVEWMREGRE